MAGPYVHCLVSEAALKLLDDTLYNRYAPIASEKYRPYVYLGSVSPDYPNPDHKMGGVDPIPYIDPATGSKYYWGDVLHKIDSGTFVKNGVKLLRDEADKRSDSFYMRTAWLMGYYSHVITDLVVHAAVYNIVGKYEDNPGDHMLCEMTEDVLLYKDIKGGELVDDKFLKILSKCQSTSAFTLDPMEPRHYILSTTIKSFWDKLLLTTYPKYYQDENPDINGWHREYAFLMKAAKSFVARGLAPGMAYKRSGKVLKRDSNPYYTDMKIPGDTNTGNYMNAVFKKSEDEVRKGWKALLSAIDDPAALRSFTASVVNADLDTGTADGVHYVMWDGGKTTDRPVVA